MNQFVNFLRNNYAKLILCALLVSSFYFVYFVAATDLKEQFNALGPLAPLGIFLLRSTSIVIPALPSTVYSLLAGALFGFKKGLIIICFADLFSCSISYYLSRYYGRGIVKRLVGTSFINRVENISERHIENNFFLMTGFLMTGLFDFVCYAAGLAKAPWKKFGPALIISVLISNPPIVALGAGILEGGKKLLIFAVLGIFGLAIVKGIINRSLLYKRKS